MKLRSIALAGVALAAMSTPALAGEGWYIGLGGGYSNPEPMKIRTAPPLSVPASLRLKDSGVVIGGVGYKWDSGLRLEVEDSYTSHDFRPTSPGVAGTLSGSAELVSIMGNLVYDWQIGDRWALSLGG
ncbi:MAG: outer membrane beta-barrel protein, partial [Alphaproteobacteria bacterium]|nr:outer membrane beta-barrel protein [Alphaproteobacteria bacterium]